MVELNKKELIVDIIKFIVIAAVIIFLIAGAVIVFNKVDYNYAIIYNPDGSIMVEGTIDDSPVIYSNTVDLELQNGERYLVDSENVTLIKRNPQAFSRIEKEDKE